jgi:protoheme IX farnesyltransferase
VALVLISLLPAAFGLGWIYLAGAVAGGGYFIVKSLDLVRTPDRKSAMANFHASLLQLGLLQIAAIADRFLLG